MLVLIAVLPCFNPKREAHPLQTVKTIAVTNAANMFQSQTGSPSSSDFFHLPLPRIENLFQSQTGSPSSSDPVPPCQLYDYQFVSIPNGKPILFRRHRTGHCRAVA